MNAFSLANSKASAPHRSNRPPSPHVLSLERAQQSAFSQPFVPQQIAHQTRPRFSSSDPELLDQHSCHDKLDIALLDRLLAQQHLMRALALSPGVGAVCEGGGVAHAPLLPPHHQHQQQQSSTQRHAWLGRLRRTLPVVQAAAASPTPTRVTQHHHKQSQRHHTNSSAESAAPPPPQQQQQQHAPAASSRSLSQSVSEQEGHYLQVLSNLAHVYNSYQDHHPSSSGGAFLRRSPRLMTAEEECVLGTIIQQHRKLWQLGVDHPDIAASAPFSSNKCSSSSSGSSSIAHVQDLSSSSSSSAPTPPKRRVGRPRKNSVSPDTATTTAAAAAASSEATSSSGSTTDSSSSSRPRATTGPDRRYKWPPALTPDDITELSQMSPDWRRMLPMLAAQAHELLVGFNTGLILYMLHRVRRQQSVPEGDLISSGLAGLRLAATRYDPAKGTRFSTAAAMWIGQHMQRSNANEAGKPLRRPEHHVQMLNYVQQHYGPQGVVGIAHRPDIVQEVAAHFKSSPGSVIEAVRDTFNQAAAYSLEATPPELRSSKADGDSSAWANLLTTADLDEEDGGGAAVAGGAGGGGAGGGAGGGGSSSMSGGAGTLLAAAGQMPSWAQASIRGYHQPAPAPAAAVGRSASRHRQQQQQQQPRGGLGGGSGPADAAAAAAAAVAASLTTTTTSTSTASMLSSVDSLLSSMEDTEDSLQRHMQGLLHILTPLERSVVTCMYGLDQGAPAGLGHELPPVDFGSISSSGSTSSSKRRRQQSAGAYSRRKGVRTLKETAEQLGLPTHQLVANIRNSALEKLTAAARGAAGAGRVGTGGLGVAGDRSSTAAAGSTSTASSSSSWDDSDADAGVPTAQMKRQYTRSSVTDLIQLLQEYVQQHGRLPAPSNSERYKGKLLGVWTARLRRRYWQGKLAPSLAVAVKAAVPEWDWGQPPPAAKRKKQQQREGRLNGAAAGAAGVSQMEALRRRRGGDRRSAAYRLQQQHQQQKPQEAPGATASATAAASPPAAPVAEAAAPTAASALAAAAGSSSRSLAAPQPQPKRRRNISSSSSKSVDAASFEHRGRPKRRHRDAQLLAAWAAADSLSLAAPQPQPSRRRRPSTVSTPTGRKQTAELSPRSLADVVTPPRSLADVVKKLWEAKKAGAPGSKSWEPRLFHTSWAPAVCETYGLSGFDPAAVQLSELVQQWAPWEQHLLGRVMGGNLTAKTAINMVNTVVSMLSYPPIAAVVGHQQLAAVRVKAEATKAALRPLWHRPRS